MALILTADDEPEFERRSVRAIATRVWLFALALMLAPAIIGWIVRGVTMASGCVPAAQSCLREPYAPLLGSAFKGLLDFAWIIGASSPVTLGLACFAALAAVFAARPVAAALTMLFGPLLALLMPIALVGQTAYRGCAVNENGLGDCVLWGKNMGATFHMAATAQELIAGYMPFAVAGALVAGLLGWIAQYGTSKMRG